MAEAWLTSRPIVDGAEVEAATELIMQDLPHCSLKRYIDERSSLLGAFDQGELIACLHWRPVTALWLGNEITIGQTGPGATALSYRGNGVMRALLRSALLQMKEAGVVLAGQETPVIGYHRTTGWEVATLANRHAAKASSLMTAIGSPHLTARLCVPDDLLGVIRVWESVIQDRPLTPIRTTGQWRDLLRSERLIAVENGAGVAGYAVLEERADSDQVLIAEVGAVTTDATKGLLRFLAAEIGAADIEWWTPSDGLDLMVFPDPRMSNPSTEIDKLVRVVDAHAVLSSLAESASAGPPFEFVVHDGVAEWNSQAFRAQPGLGVELASKADHLPWIDVRAIAALCCGTVSAGDLASADLLAPDLAVPFALLEPSSHRRSWYPEPL